MQLRQKFAYWNQSLKQLLQKHQDPSLLELLEHEIYRFDDEQEQIEKQQNVSEVFLNNKMTQLQSQFDWIVNYIYQDDIQRIALPSKKINQSTSNEKKKSSNDSRKRSPNLQKEQQSKRTTISKQASSQKYKQQKEEINENDPEWLNNLITKYRKNKSKGQNAKLQERNNKTIPKNLDQSKSKISPSGQILTELSQDVELLSQGVLRMKEDLGNHSHFEIDNELQKVQLEHSTIKTNYNKLKQTNEQIVLMVKELNQILIYQADRQKLLQEEINQLIQQSS